MAPPVPDARPPSRDASPGGRRGRRVAQILFFSVLTWMVVSGAAEILSETVFARRVPRGDEACREELASLRSRLADASMRDTGQGEQPAVRAFRSALSADSGRSWDTRVLELVDGCPRPEAEAAYALARLRAAHEAMVRIDAQQAAPARHAHERATAALNKDLRGAGRNVAAPAATSSTVAPAPSAADVHDGTP